MKTSFVFFRDWWEIIDDMPQEHRCELYDSIMRYAFTDEEQSPTEALHYVFSLIAKQIDRNVEKWDDVREKRAAAGRIGMRNRWKNENAEITNDNKNNKCYKPITKITNDNKNNYNVNVNVNDNVNVNVKKEKEKKDTLSCVEKKQKEFDKRKQVFYDDCAKYVQRYGRELVRDFFDYWTEQYQHDAFKMRKDGEKTWNTARRLSTWNKRTIKDNNYGTDRNKTEETNRKAAELLRSGAGAESQTPDF